ncbi:MAG: hypothetical protein ACLQVW_07140, partial [Limisphaerales bacterium]
YAALLCFINDEFLQLRSNIMDEQRKFFNILIKLNFDTQMIVINRLAGNNENNIINLHKFLSLPETILFLM